MTRVKFNVKKAREFVADINPDEFVVMLDNAGNLALSGNMAAEFFSLACAREFCGVDRASDDPTEEEDIIRIAEAFANKDFHAEDKNDIEFGWEKDHPEASIRGGDYGRSEDFQHPDY